MGGEKLGWCLGGDWKWRGSCRYRLDHMLQSDGGRHPVTAPSPPHSRGSSPSFVALSPSTIIVIHKHHTAMCQCSSVLRNPHYTQRVGPGSYRARMSRTCWYLGCEVECAFCTGGVRHVLHHTSEPSSRPSLTAFAYSPVPATRPFLRSGILASITSGLCLFRSRCLSGLTTGSALATPFLRGSCFAVATRRTIFLQHWRQYAFPSTSVT